MIKIKAVLVLALTFGFTTVAIETINPTPTSAALIKQEEHGMDG